MSHRLIRAHARQTAQKSAEERALARRLGEDMPGNIDAWVGSLEPYEDEIGAARERLGCDLSDEDDDLWCAAWRAELKRLLAEAEWWKHVTEAARVPLRRCPLGGTCEAIAGAEGCPAQRGDMPRTSGCAYRSW